MSTQTRGSTTCAKWRCKGTHLHFPAGLQFDSQDIAGSRKAAAVGVGREDAGTEDLGLQELSQRRDVEDRRLVVQQGPRDPAADVEEGALCARAALEERKAAESVLPAALLDSHLVGANARVDAPELNVALVAGDAGESGERLVFGVRNGFEAEGGVAGPEEEAVLDHNGKSKHN